MFTEIQNHNSYKIGLNEIQDLKSTMMDLFKPVQRALKKHIYWSEVEITEAEYKGRDGFIPHSHNCGGLQISEVIPDCEQCDFSYLDFGDWDGEHYCDETDTENCECPFAVDGEYDAALYVWFKFEGLNDDGSANFYLILHGGNNDAPYFRHKYSTTYFEADFEATSLDDLRRKAQKPIQDLIKLINKG